MGFSFSFLVILVKRKKIQEHFIFLGFVSRMIITLMNYRLYKWNRKFNGLSKTLRAIPTGKLCCRATDHQATAVAG